MKALAMVGNPDVVEQGVSDMDEVGLVDRRGDAVAKVDNRSCIGGSEKIDYQTKSNLHNVIGLDLQAKALSL